MLLQLRQRKFWSIHIQILTNFKKLIFKQFRTFYLWTICTFYRSQKTCTWLDEQFRTFHPSLLESVAHVGTFSLNLRKRLYKSVSKSLPQWNIKVIFQSKNQLSSFFRFKDSIPLYLRFHLIYKFQCSNCNVTYYGETERHLKVRAGKHISMPPLTGKSVNNNKKSSVKDSCLLSSHVCSFEDFTVLNYDSHKFKRLIKESLFVTKDKPLLYKQIKSLKLELLWFNSI